MLIRMHYIHTPIKRMKKWRNTNIGKFAIDCRRMRGLIRYVLAPIVQQRVKAAATAALQQYTTCT